MNTAATDGTLGGGLSTSALMDALDELAMLAKREPLAVAAFIQDLLKGEKVTMVTVLEGATQLAPSGFLRGFLAAFRAVKPGSAGEEA